MVGGCLRWVFAGANIRPFDVSDDLNDLKFASWTFIRQGFLLIPLAPTPIRWKLIVFEVMSGIQDLISFEFCLQLYPVASH